MTLLGLIGPPQYLPRYRYQAKYDESSGHCFDVNVFVGKALKHFERSQICNINNNLVTAEKKSWNQIIFTKVMF